MPILPGKQSERQLINSHRRPPKERPGKISSLTLTPGCHSVGLAGISGHGSHRAFLDPKCAVGSRLGEWGGGASHALIHHHRLPPPTLLPTAAFLPAHDLLVVSTTPTASHNNTFPSPCSSSGTYFHCLGISSCHSTAEYSQHSTRQLFARHHHLLANGSHSIIAHRT